jgi:FkbM family methyltransferase
VPNFTEGLSRHPFLAVEQVPISFVEIEKLKLKFHMYGEYTEFRVRTLLTKEHETVDWISTFSKEDVFWDIGANIGIYTLFAAARGAHVFAFEPSPTNFWLLNQNVALNDLGNVTCMSLAIAKRREVTGFNVDLSPAAAGINQVNSKITSLLVQTYPIDDLVFSLNIPAPRFLKLDVDGNELEILEGGLRALSLSSTRAVMCEVDESNRPLTSEIHALMVSSGFQRVITRHPPYFEQNYYLPSANHLFLKD